MKITTLVILLFLIKFLNTQTDIITSEFIESKFPNWYSLPLNCKETPGFSSDSIKAILNGEVKEMDKLIEQEISIHRDSIYNYYSISMEKRVDLDSLLNQWKSQREILAMAYLYSNNGSGRGISQLCFYRDYTKAYLLMLVSIYP